jgi:hypothetical protein
MHEEFQIDTHYSQILVSTNKSILPLTIASRFVNEGLQALKCLAGAVQPNNTI